MVPWSSNPKRSLTVLAIKTMVALIFSRNNFFSADAEQEERKGGPRFPENSAGGKIIEELFFFLPLLGMHLAITREDFF
jgi:hypothetical protein